MLKIQSKLLDEGGKKDPFQRTKTKPLQIIKIVNHGDYHAKIFLEKLFLFY